MDLMVASTPSGTAGVRGGHKSSVEGSRDEGFVGISSAGQIKFMAQVENCQCYVALPLINDRWSTTWD